MTTSATWRYDLLPSSSPLPSLSGLILPSACCLVCTQLRTSPRALGEGVTREGYVAILLDEVRRWRGRMIVRVLLSVDRSWDPADALEVANLAIVAQREGR